MFRLLRLNPPHGWRAVWWELAIVTAGVLLALVAQQLVEAANWRSRAADAKVRLTGELNSHYAQLYEQASVAECIDGQLNRLAAMTADGVRPTTYQDEFYGSIVYRAPHRDYNDNVWQSIGSEGVIRHLDRGFTTLLSTYYTQLGAMRANVVEVEGIERQFGVLTRDVTLGHEVRLGLVQQIEAARTLVRAITVDANQLLKLLAQAGVTLTDGERRALLPNSRTQAFCRARGLPVGRPDDAIPLS